MIFLIICHFFLNFTQTSIAFNIKSRQNKRKSDLSQSRHIELNKSKTYINSHCNQSHVAVWRLSVSHTLLVRCAEYAKTNQGKKCECISWNTQSVLPYMSLCLRNSIRKTRTRMSETLYISWQQRSHLGFDITTITIVRFVAVPSHLSFQFTVSARCTRTDGSNFSKQIRIYSSFVYWTAMDAISFKVFRD